MLAQSIAPRYHFFTVKTTRLFAAAAAALVPLALACHREQPSTQQHETGSPLGGKVFGPNAEVVHSPAQHDSERAAGFRWLFDGTDASAWKGWRKDSIGPGWHVMDGMLMRQSQDGVAGDIITRDTFANFELRLDWKLEPGGNSGIMYHVRNPQSDSEATYMSGPEYQVLDDSGYADGRNRLTSAAADYGLYPSPAGIVRRPGQWNEARIIVNGPHVEHWLNGVKVVDYQLWSDDWKAKVAASKFRAWPEYGMSRSGHIALQDHSGPVYFRDIRIKVLP